jgi:AcrR family transcriptional regulator
LKGVKAKPQSPQKSPQKSPQTSVLASEKREQILQGAMQVFLKHGYAGTSMDRVAAIAGVSKQTI